MLGQSSAGKTSYVSAMYEAMNEGAGGFTVRAERPADHQRLARTARALRQGTYPAASDRRSTYQLGLRHSGVPIFDFVWKDYRGGALTETSDSPQAVQLRADAAAAGGLVLMIDSTRLADGPRARAHVRPLIATLIRLLADCAEPTALVVALTKWDLVQHDEERAAARASELLSGLIDAVAQTRNVYGVIVPVSCGLRPVNVVHPVLWCLYIGIAKRGRSMQQNIAYYEQVAAEALRRAGLLDKVRSWWRNEPTWEEIRRQARLQVDREMRALAPLISASEALAPAFESALKF